MFVDDEPREETERVPVELLRWRGGCGGWRWCGANDVAVAPRVLSIGGRVGFNEGDRPLSFVSSETCISSERLYSRILGLQVLVGAGLPRMQILRDMHLQTPLLATRTRSANEKDHLLVAI